MTLVCDYCQTPIEGGREDVDYNLSPSGEPVHTGECHTATWDADGEVVKADGGEVVDEPEVDVEAHHLPEEEVADNFRDYIEALEQEIAMSEATIEALEAGDLATDEMVDALPTPTPLEAWQSDTWDELGEDYDPMELKPADVEADDGE